MKLREGIRLYIKAKRMQGVEWIKGAQILRCFGKEVGNLPLHLIRVHHAESFLGDGLVSRMWGHKYGVLHQFFLYWVAHQEISGLPLPPRCRPLPQTFVRYIYSRAELHRLLVSTSKTQRGFMSIFTARTFRTLLLFLYGTGVLLGEALRLERSDIDFRKRRITIRNDRFERTREIPIAPDLLEILRRYHKNVHRKGTMIDPQFFLTVNGEKLNDHTVQKTFERLRRVAEVVRTDGSRYQPRLHDLRHTFAVHRLTAWYKRGADLNRMLPALAAYMGMSDLRATGRYRALTPERFRKQLNTLSPMCGKKRWRDDAQLMKFLDSL